LCGRKEDGLDTAAAATAAIIDVNVISRSIVGLQDDMVEEFPSQVDINISCRSLVG